MIEYIYMVMEVFPTPVGMDRYTSSGSGNWSSFSPRPWGWTVARAARERTRVVFPTPVGMDRSMC